MTNRYAMKNSERIQLLLKQNDGIITSSEITQLGISRGNLKYLVDKGYLERAARGVYKLVDVWDDELYYLQVRLRKGIYSKETALYLHHLSDRTPHRYQMTFPNGYNLTKIDKVNLDGSRVIDELYDVGVVELSTPSGNKVRVYNMERTLCDILRKQSHVDVQSITTAFKLYTKRKDMNIPLLSEYAKKLKVEAKLRSYLEVLL